MTQKEQDELAARVVKPAIVHSQVHHGDTHFHPECMTCNALRIQIMLEVIEAVASAREAELNKQPTGVN